MAVLAERAIRAALLIALLSAPSATTRAALSDEYAMMALYIYNFAKFTRWPDRAFDSGNAPLDLCVLGEDRFGVALDDLEGRSVGTRTLRIRRYPRVAVVAGCHILFVSHVERQRLDLILRAVEHLPILTVSDIERFSDRGGMITFSTRDRQLRFAVNPYAVVSAELAISSKLLELATIVVSDR